MSEGVYARMQKEKVRVMEEITKEQGIDKSALIKGFRLLYARLEAFLELYQRMIKSWNQDHDKKAPLLYGGLNDV